MKLFKRETADSDQGLPDHVVKAAKRAKRMNDLLLVGWIEETSREVQRLVNTSEDKRQARVAADVLHVLVYEYSGRH